MHEPFAEAKDVSGFYPVMEGAPVEKQTYLTMNWVIGSGSDPVTTMELDFLSDVLVNQESAPIRKALQEAGIGSDIYATSQGMLQNIFSIVVQNANAGDKEKFRNIVMSALEKVYSGKIDRETLKGSVNRMEFRLREGNDAQKGLSYSMRSMNCWIYTNDPFPPLEYEKTLSTIKESLTGSILEEIIKKDLIDNPYMLTLTLGPKPGLEKEMASRTADELTAIRKKMSPAEIDAIIASTEALIAFQQKEDSSEAISTVPMLKLSDINTEAMWFEPVKQNLHAVPHLFYDEFTNGIVYMNYWFDLRVLPEDKIPYAALLTQILGKMDTGSYTYDELDNALNINTGGYSASLASYLPEHDDNRLIPDMKIQMKTTMEKLETALSILAEILTNTRIDNKERLL